MHNESEPNQQRPEESETNVGEETQTQAPPPGGLSQKHRRKISEGIRRAHRRKRAEARRAARAAAGRGNKRAVQGSQTRGGRLHVLGEQLHVAPKRGKKSIRRKPPTKGTGGGKKSTRRISAGAGAKPRARAPWGSRTRGGVPVSADSGATANVRTLRIVTAPQKKVSMFENLMLNADSVTFHTPEGDITFKKR